MPRTGGTFTRTSNSFSNPSLGTAIDPTHADTLFDDYDTALTASATKDPQYVTLATDTVLTNERVLTAALTNRLHEVSLLLDAGKQMNAVLELNELLDTILRRLANCSTRPAAP